MLTLEDIEDNRHSDPPEVDPEPEDEPHACDETCSLCPTCYTASGVERCSRACPHAEE